jgi:hypothetical protein
MTPDIEDIARRLRQTRADMIGTDDEQHYWDSHEAAGEIERLRQWGRLTDAERQAVALMAEVAADPRGGAVPAGCEVAATLRGLLERMSGNAALSGVGQSPSTPNPHATPGECTVPPQWREDVR